MVDLNTQLQWAFSIVAGFGIVLLCLCIAIKNGAVR